MRAPVFSRRPVMIAGMLLSLVFLGYAACSTKAADRPRTTVNRTLAQTLDVPADTRITIDNLLGHVTVVRGDSKLGVEVTVVAGGEDHEHARALAGRVRLKIAREGGVLGVHVVYPVETYDRYRYVLSSQDAAEEPRKTFHLLGLTFLVPNHGNTTTTYQGRRIRLVGGKAKGTPLHVDLVLRLPPERATKIYNRMGWLRAADVNNRLMLRTDTGDIAGNHLAGTTRLVTGSGDVALADQSAGAAVHTGSGDIHASRLRAPRAASHDAAFDLETGSGDVRIETIRGALRLRTGSGEVGISDIKAMPRLTLRTGSGNIELRGIHGIQHADVVAGSGNIALAGDLSALGDFTIRSGSGNVRLDTNRPPPVTLDAVTGSGDIDVRWSGLRDVTSSPHRFSSVVSAAMGHGEIKTGSGNITLSSKR